MINNIVIDLTKDEENDLSNLNTEYEPIIFVKREEGDNIILTDEDDASLELVKTYKGRGDTNDAKVIIDDLVLLVNELKKGEIDPMFKSWSYWIKALDMLRKQENIIIVTYQKESGNKRDIAGFSLGYINHYKLCCNHSYIFEALFTYVIPKRRAEGIARKLNEDCETEFLKEVVSFMDNAAINADSVTVQMKLKSLKKAIPFWESFLSTGNSVFKDDISLDNLHVFKLYTMNHERYLEIKETINNGFINFFLDIGFTSPLYYDQTIGDTCNQHLPEFAIFNDRPDILDWLLLQGLVKEVDLEYRRYFKEQPLIYIAAKKDAVKCVRYLFDKFGKSQFDQSNADGKTPLFIYSYYKNNVDMLFWMIKNSDPARVFSCCHIYDDLNYEGCLKYINRKTKHKNLLSMALREVTTDELTEMERKMLTWLIRTLPGIMIEHKKGYYFQYDDDDVNDDDFDNTVKEAMVVNRQEYFKQLIEMDHQKLVQKIMDNDKIFDLVCTELKENDAR